MARIGTRLLQITIGGSDYTAQLSKAVITADDSDSDFTTFADAAAGGGRSYKLEMTAAQDAATGTVFDKIWTAAGTSVACTLKPYGNTAASVTQPWYTFNAIVKEPNGDFIGGEADSSVTAAFTMDLEWPLDGKPTKVTS